MAWTPDSSLSSLVERIIQHHQEKALTEMRDLAARIANRRSADGTLRGGNHVVEVRDAHIARVREYADTVTREVVELVSGSDGTLDPDAVAWIRQQLEPQLMAMASGIADAIETSPAIRGLEGDPKEGARRALRESVTTFADRLNLDLGIALDKAMMRSAAVTRAKGSDPALMDVLVPLPGRRAFDADLPEAIAAAQESQEPLALVAFDIDDFKKVNDEHGGHAVGDAALIEVAKLAESCVRGKGTAYRLSGDEFVIVLPNHTAQEAVALAERLRRSVNEARLSPRQLTLSLSVGVAEFPTHATDITGLKEAADAAAYDAKHRGKNLVRISGEPPPVVPGPAGTRTSSARTRRVNGRTEKDHST